MRPDPRPRAGPPPCRPATGHPGTAGNRATIPTRVPESVRPPDDQGDHGGRGDADLAALRAIAALARLYSTAAPAGPGPDTGHLARLEVIRDLLIAHLAGGRARRAVTTPAHRPHDAPPAGRS